MTPLLSVIATLALAADPAAQGLPFGVPPAPEDAVIASVAPPHCLFYFNWAGTASPSASSGSETEKLLAEPEVQEFLRAVSQTLVTYVRKNEAKEKAAIAENTQAGKPEPINPDQQPGVSHPPQAGHVRIVERGGAAKLPHENIAESEKLPGSGGKAIPPKPTDEPALPVQYDNPAASPPSEACVPERRLLEIAPNAPSITASPLKLAETPGPDVSREEVLDWLTALFTHPTAAYLDDVRIGPTAKAVAEKKEPGNLAADAAGIWQMLGDDSAMHIEVRAGFVVSFGKDAAPLQAKFSKYMQLAFKSDQAAGTLARVKIAGETWYRLTPLEFEKKDNVVTFGFHGKYFVAAYGHGEVEAMLGRWHKPKPAWLAQAMAQSDVARRTGILYVNLKALREKLVAFAGPQMAAKDKKELADTLDLLGLENVDSFVSTTGLEDYGMIGRTLLTTSSEPHGLLGMVSDRPLTDNDLEPIPHDALLAIAMRMDLDRALRDLLAFYDKAGALSPDLQKQVADVKKQLDDLKTEQGIDLHHILSAVGDSWRIYNAPSEGEIPFLGWTAVVSIRDRPALVEAWEKLCAEVEKKRAKSGENESVSPGGLAPLEFRKCRFAGREIYYIAKQPVVPAFYIGEREMVITLNMPAMKAYLARKEHRSLAAQPGVALAMKGKTPPAALFYCNMPELFSAVYPWCTLMANVEAGELQKQGIDLNPSFWPSAPAIRAHLRPEITSIERSPHGLEFTSRYSLPTGGLTGLLVLASIGAESDAASSRNRPLGEQDYPVSKEPEAQALSNSGPDKRPEIPLPTSRSMQEFIDGMHGPPRTEPAGAKPADEPKTPEPAPAMPAAAPGGKTSLNGRLYKNMGEGNLAMPYLLLDQYGVVVGYLAAGAGVDLESHVGREVKVQGAPGKPCDGTPCVTCEKIAGNGG